MCVCDREKARERQREEEKKTMPVCVCVFVCREKKKSVLTAQSNDVAAVFVDKLLSHCFLHNLLHLRTKEQNLSLCLASMSSLS